MDFRWGEQNGPSLGFASTSGRTQSFNDDSVNLANGNLVKGYTVLDFPTKCVPLRIYPFYNAQDTYRGPFGFGWSFAYDTHLTELTPGGDVMVKSTTGAEYTYTSTPSGYEPPVLITAALTKNQDGTFEMRYRDDGVLSFDSSGRLTTVADADGNTLTLTRDAWGKLLQIEDDASGRTVTFTHDAGGFVTAVTGPDGATTTLEYAYDLVTRITGPGGFVTAYEYDSRRRIVQKTDARGLATRYVYDQYQ